MRSERTARTHISQGSSALTNYWGGPPPNHHIDRLDLEREWERGREREREGGRERERRERGREGEVVVKPMFVVELLQIWGWGGWRDDGPHWSGSPQLSVCVFLWCILTKSKTWIAKDKGSRAYFLDTIQPFFSFTEGRMSLCVEDAPWVPVWHLFWIRWSPHLHGGITGDFGGACAHGGAVWLHMNRDRLSTFYGNCL